MERKKPALPGSKTRSPVCILRAVFRLASAEPLSSIIFQLIGDCAEFYSKLRAEEGKGCDCCDRDQRILYRKETPAGGAGVSSHGRSGLGESAGDKSSSLPTPRAWFVSVKSRQKIRRAVALREPPKLNYSGYPCAGGGPPNSVSRRRAP